MNFPTGATCAVHPQATSVATCARCGNYMCAQCQSPQRPEMCNTCIHHVGSFPLNRENVTVSGAFNFALERFKVHALMLSGLAFVYIAFMAVASGVNGAIQAALIVSSPKLLIPVALMLMLIVNVCSALVIAPIARASVVALTENEVTFDHVMQGVRRSPAYIAQMLLTTLLSLPMTLPQLITQTLTGLGEAPPAWTLFAMPLCFLVYMFPMIYVLLGVSQTGLEAQIDPEVSIGDAFQRSWAVASGKRLTLFGGGFVTGLVALAGFLACCVGIIPAMGLGLTIWSALYLGLRTGMMPEPRQFTN